METTTIIIIIIIIIIIKGCIAWEANDYYPDGIVAENSLVRNNKDSKESCGKLQEKEWPEGSLAINYDLHLWCDGCYNICQK